MRPRRWIGLPPALACLAFAAGARADEPPAPGPAPAAAPTGAASGEAEQTPSSGAGLGSANRLVVEIAAVGGYTFGNLTRADLRSIDGTGYLFSSNTGGQFLATCGSTDALPGSGECRALSDPGSSGTVGAELLMGWAVDEGVIFGGRFLAGANLPGGLLIAAGPAASVRVGPVWIGGGVALGTLHYRANLTGALGSVPAEFQDASGASEIEIPFEHLPVKRDTLHTKFILGVTLEVTGAVYDVEAGSDDVGRGSLVIGGWPTVVYTFPGVGLSIPVGIGYRFY